MFVLQTNQITSNVTNGSCCLVGQWNDRDASNDPPPTDVLRSYAGSVAVLPIATIPSVLYLSCQPDLDIFLFFRAASFNDLAAKLHAVQYKCPPHVRTT